MRPATEYQIYAITSADYWYVGSASSPNSSAQRRFKCHVNGNGGAPLLHEKLRDLGTEAFQLEILEYGYGDPIAAETRWYEFGLTAETRKCLNKRRPDYRDTHWLHCELTRAHKKAIGDALRGQKRRPLTMIERANLSAALRGRPHTAEHTARAQDSRRQSGGGKRASQAMLCTRWNVNRGKPCVCGRHEVGLRVE